MPLRDVEFQLPEKDGYKYNLIICGWDAGENIECSRCHKFLHPVKNEEGAPVLMWELFELVPLGSHPFWMGMGYVCTSCKGE
jgi:hypothetical protein